MSLFVSAFCSLAYLFSSSCAMWTLFSVFSIIERDGAPGSVLLLWLACIALCRAVLGLYLRRQRSERSLIIVCAVFFVLQLAITFGLYRFWPGFSAALICCAMWLYSYYRCFELSSKGLAAEALGKCFDLCCLILVFALFFCSVKALGLGLVLPLAASLVMCLFALILIRGGERPRFRALLLGAVLVLGFGAVSALVAVTVSGGAAKLVELLLSAIRFVGRCIHRALLHLLSLLPQKQYDYELAAPEELAQVAAQDMSFQLIDPDTLIIGVILFAFAIVIVAIICRLVFGRGRMLGTVSAADKGITRQRMGLALVLKRFFARLWSAIRFKLLSISKRNTAPGLFVELEKRSRAQLHGRKDSETCREFLSRAKAVYPHAGAELMELADMLDEFYFGKAKATDPNRIILLRKSILRKNPESS